MPLARRARMLRYADGAAMLYYAATIMPLHAYMFRAAYARLPS